VLTHDQISEASRVPEILTDLIDIRAALSPDRLAYRFCPDGESASDTITYLDLRTRATHIARALSREITPGERVVVACPPGLDFISSFLGCLYAGGIAVPTYPPIRLKHQPSIERFERVVDDSGAAAVLTAPVLAAGLRTQADSSAVLRRVSILASSDLPGSLEEHVDFPCSRVRPEDPAMLQYTSGSTMRSRGVVLTHANLLYNSKIISDLFGSSATSVGVIWLPPYHDMGLIGGILQPLFAGFPVTLFSPFRFAQRPLRWLQAITKWKGTISGGPNFAYDLCLRKISAEERIGLDLSSWTVAFNGAETVRADTLEEFAKVFRPHGFRREAFYPCYGLAEATLLVTGGDKERPPTTAEFRAAAMQQGKAVAESGADLKLVGVGQPATGTTVVVADSETKRRAADGVVGEIWVQGPGLGIGYWNRSQETELTFQEKLDTGEGPFLRTGDLGFFHDGELFVTGRLKDLIVIHGLKYRPEDIEWSAQSVHSGIRAAAAFTLADDSACSLVVVAEWEFETDEPRDIEASIRLAIAERFGLRVDRVALGPPGTIPRTTSGKIQRQMCRSCFATAVESNRAVLVATNRR
jgi:acyl-CoA synthetase (AMP-forming)/AMP-acid ligase II